jgi:hypothetical protein
MTDPPESFFIADDAGTDGIPRDLSEVMDFSSYDLPTTIRLIVLSGEGRRIEIRRGTRQGAVFIKAGEIYRVVTGDKQGDEAFFEILGWHKTTHRDFKEHEPPEPNVRISTNVLLAAMQSEIYLK